MKRINFILFFGILFLIGFTSATISLNLTTPANNTYSNNLTQTLSTSVSSTVNLSNATIRVWNSSGSLYSGGAYMYDTGKALRFDGSDDYITTPTINHNIGTGNFAYSAWVYPLAYSGSPTGSSIIANGNYYPLIYINTKNLSIYSGGGTDLKCNVNLNNWSHITVTRTSGIIRGYVNGIICPINPTITTSYTNAGQAIGRNGVSSTGDYFNGSIDQVLVFNRSLNSTEIAQLYNSGMGLYANTSLAPFNSGLVVGYHFDNNSAMGENNTNFVDINGVNNATCSGIYCPNYTAGFLRGPAFLTSTINFTMGVYNATLGSIINFINGIYTWAYQIFDSTGASSMGPNYTLNIDTISPTFESFSPANNTLTRNTLVTFNTNISDDNGIENATLNIFNSEGENVALEKTIYDYTGEDQSFTVPEGVTSISVKAWGGGGAGYNYAGSANRGGGGGYSTTELTVAPGENLTIVVGSGGSVCPSATNPGAIVYGGGGQCGDLGYGGQGGGLSGVFNGSETVYFNSTSQSRTLIIAGGGGGAGAMGGVGNIGGAGGGLFGDASNCSGVNGMPGSQTSGGIGYGVNGSGSALKGGRASDSDGGGGGGGGAGYFGGGAGTNGASGTDGCGGGGSGYAITGTTTAGNGQDPGSKEDIDRGTAGIGGNTDVAGNNGRVIITYSKINYSNSVFSEDLKNANITATTSLSDGNYTWFFESYDLAGNYNASENSTLVADVTSPQISFAIPSGTGGNIIYDGNYTVHTFLSNGTFIPSVGITNISVLVVAGGGGGGKAEPNLWGDGAGGGGGGGLIYNTSYSLSGNIEVVIGNGGQGSTVNNAKGSNGTNSVFGSLIAIGGGGGGSDNHDATNTGASGGSGGGSASMHTGTVSGSLGILGQGNNGSASIFSGRRGGGGGGAGAAAFVSQNGGTGLNYSINGSNSYYAGGGGGGAGEYTDTFGTGGSGIGGNGGIRGAVGGNAVANTGSGGGGGGTNNASGNGGNGSSGIIVVRYLTPLADTEENNSIKAQNYIFARANLIESDLANVTYKLYNSSFENINTTNYNTEVTTINWTNIPRGVYYYNISACDTSGNCNSTETRMITLNTTTPTINITNPQNNTFASNGTINFTANLSDVVDGIKNATLYVYNQTDLVNQTNLVGFNSGTALSFDGSNDYVSIPYNSLYNTGSGNFTFSFWYYPKDVGYQQAIFASDTDLKWGVVYDMPAGQQKFNIWAGSGSGWDILQSDSASGANSGVGTITCPPNSWYHIVFQKEGNFYRLYVNGTLDIERERVGYSIISRTEPFILGRWGASGDRMWNRGNIEEFDFWNRSLNSTEISQLYNSGAGLYANTSIAPFSNGLVAGYHFDEGSGTTAIDITGVNNGTLINSPTYVTGKVKTPLVTFDSGVLTATVGIVVNLAEGIYNWFYQLFDWAGNMGTSANNTLTIDRTYPLIEFDPSNPANETGLADAFNLTVLINETNIANVTVNFNSTNYAYDFVTNASYFTNIAGNKYKFTAPFGPLGPTENNSYNITVTDKAGQTNSTETRLVTGNRPPSLVSLTQSPSANASLDPLVLVELNATLLDGQNNFESAWLQVTNNSSDWSNLIENILMTNSGNLTNIILNASFTLPNYEANISYRIFANDTVGGEANLTIYNISNYYDCTWAVTNNLGGKAGYSENIEVGRLIINNTGDYNYSNDHCTLYFGVKHSLDSKKLYFDNRDGATIRPYGPLTPGNILNISVNYSFGEIFKSEAYTINTTETYIISETALRQTTGSAVTNQEGPYLFQSINNYPASIYIVPQTITLDAYISNLMGDDIYNETNSAFNISSNWTIGNYLTNASGNLSNLFENVSMSIENNLSISLNATNWSTITSGIYSFSLKSEGYNFAGSLISDANNNTEFNNSINISFLCNTISDGFDAKGCWPTDPDTVYCGNGHIDDNETCSSCSSDVGACAETGSAGSGAGGSGGGGAGGGSFDKSSATFELVRGDNQYFDLVLENKLASPKKDITITIKGNNSQYVIPEISVINYLSANSKETVKFRINAPSYFSSGKYLLEITFAGNVEGNTSTKFTEVKYVTLIILEMPRKEADGYVNTSLEILAKMNSSGFMLDEVNALLASMNSNYESLNFNSLKEGAAKIEEIYTAATEYIKLHDDLASSMNEAENNGVSVSETKKLFYLAEILFNRGDYVAAYAKLKEAKTSFLLETKGEFKILYAIKNNPVEALGIFISLSALGLGSSYFVRLRLLKRKLRVLAEEEGLLLQLMRVVQRDCFENNKMSMEEYGEAMYQYETRLSNIVQDKVTTETILANLLKIGGRKKALDQEKDRLTSLVRQTQEDYLNRGKLDTRIYENMLKTYSSRLGKIEEELVFIEAQEQINHVSSFWKRIFG